MPISLDEVLLANARNPLALAWGGIKLLEPDLIPYHAVTTLGTGPALVLAPHPDDEVLGCGGSIAAHREAGDAVHVIVLTDGAAYVDPARRVEWIAQRQVESRAAARILDYGEPSFWEYRDRELSCDELLVTRILNAVQQTKSRLIYAPSLYERHPDHRVTAWAALEVLKRLHPAVTLILYEAGAPLNPNCLLDITRFAALKTRAIECFTSQLALQDYSRHILALNAFRTYTLPREIQLAEGYLIVEPTMPAGSFWDPNSPERMRQCHVDP